MRVERPATRAAGVPSKTTRPPSWPAPGPRSIARTVLERQQVDILVNNAGTQDRYPAVDFPLEDWDNVIDVNLRSVFQLCQLFGRPMLERGHGKIVNLASLLSFQGRMTVPAHAASKGAVAQLTKGLCNEWAGQGVNVNAVAPGYMATEMNAALLAGPPPKLRSWWVQREVQCPLATRIDQTRPQ